MHLLWTWVFVSLTLWGMLSSKSGKVITLAALPTHSTTTVANICTKDTPEEISSALSAWFSHHWPAYKEPWETSTYLSYSHTYWRGKPGGTDETEPQHEPTCTKQEKARNDLEIRPGKRSKVSLRQWKTSLADSGANGLGWLAGCLRCPSHSNFPAATLQLARQPPPAPIHSRAGAGETVTCS